MADRNCAGAIETIYICFITRVEVLIIALTSCKVKQSKLIDRGPIVFVKLGSDEWWFTVALYSFRCSISDECVF